MRKVQITIKMDLFGDQSWDGHHEKVGVYADANTPHEALSAALYELLGALQEQGHKLPGFGCRHHKCDPAASGLTEEEKNAVREQRRAETEQKRRQFWETYDNTQKED